MDARNTIRDRIQRAVSSATEIAPLVLPEGLAALEIERQDPWPAQIKPGAERLDAFTIRFTGDHSWQVFHHCFYNKPDLPLPF